MGATSFSAATGVAVGECFGFGFGAADCSGAAVADCSGAGVGVFGSETGAGDRCVESNNILPTRAKRIMGFISKLNPRNDGAHEVFLDELSLSYSSRLKDSLLLVKDRRVVKREKEVYGNGGRMATATERNDIVLSR